MRTASRETKKTATMADISLYLSNVNVSIGPALEVEQVSKQLFLFVCFSIITSCRFRFVNLMWPTMPPKASSLLSLVSCVMSGWLAVVLHWERSFHTVPSGYMTV